VDLADKDHLCVKTTLIIEKDSQYHFMKLNIGKYLCR